MCPGPKDHFLSSPDDTNIPRSYATVTAVAWAPDGSVAVPGNQAGELTLWQEAKAVVPAQVTWGSLLRPCEVCPGHVCDAAYCVCLEGSLAWLLR